MDSSEYCFKFLLCKNINKKSQQKKSSKISSSKFNDEYKYDIFDWFLDTSSPKLNSNCLFLWIRENYVFLERNKCMEVFM